MINACDARPVAPDYQIARFLIERGLGAIYFIAFVVALRQFPALCGERGLEPAPRFLRAARSGDAPSLFHWRYSDRLLRVVGWRRRPCSPPPVVVGLPQRGAAAGHDAVWLVLWVLYLSIMNIGGTFYGFGWESLLLEAGFLAVFLGNATTAPPLLIDAAFRWLAFRVEFGAGLIKLRGDPCWRKLTCMDYHHETQPLPNPLSWFVHHAPRPFHRLEALGNFVAQLVLPFGLFLPQPIASIAAALMIATQLYLVVTRQLRVAQLGDDRGADRAASRTRRSGCCCPGSRRSRRAPSTRRLVRRGRRSASRSSWSCSQLLAGAEPAQPAPGDERLVQPVPPGQHVRRVRQRHADALRGDRRGHRGRRRRRPRPTGASTNSRPSPATPRRLPPQVAPYHLRLDWLMWFIPISPALRG